MGIPPSILDTELSYVSDKGFESSFAASPGLLFGQRSSSKKGPYVGAGGGLVINANGSGPGIYVSFGADIGCSSGGGVCFHSEFKQAVGIGGGTLISPYALRIGASFWF